MTGVPTERKVRFPKIREITLEHFDLYGRRPDASITVEREVFCLIGANGLGKSTFLNTLLFVMTGAIPDRQQRFQGGEEYFREASRVDKSDDYFSGRLSEGVHELAKATVILAWPSKEISITRDIFGGAKISELTIRDLDNNSEEKIQSDAEDSLSERYQREIISLTGLSFYYQFVFLLHFICVFDEDRHLILWDKDALTAALYLAFGSDPEAARKADRLQRDVERAGSRARNARFAARQSSDRISELTQILVGDDTSDPATQAEIHARYAGLVNELEHAEGRARRKENEMRQADARWADLSASLSETQLEYRRLFASRVNSTNSMHYHPVVRASISEDRCAVCGTTGVSEQIAQIKNSNTCPLCRNHAGDLPKSEEIVNDLQRLDKIIEKLRADITNSLQLRERVEAEREAALSSERAARSALKEFEDQNPAASYTSVELSDQSNVGREIRNLEAERDRFREESQKHYRNRDLLRKELLQYEKKLKQQYENYAGPFIDRFRELAEDFIGLPVDIDIQHRRGVNDSGFDLQLSLDAQFRAQPEDVSESQRFFLDIALRMALAEFMSEGCATLIIDTPEGSLDIAYEARAGSMFSSFVESGNLIVMTANLRSSALVLRLAERQKKDGMQTVRMTDWTHLSEVQQTEEDLFTQAFDQIEAALS